MVFAAALLAVAVGGCGSGTTSPSPHTPSPTPSTLAWHKVFGVTGHFIVLEDVPTPVFRLAKGRVRVVATMFGSAEPGSAMEFAVALARAGGRKPWMYFPMPTNPGTPTKWTVDLKLPHAVPAGRYELMVLGNGLSYDATVFERAGQ
jgi:hypothetical protein